MPQNDLRKTYKTSQVKHENIIPNDMMVVEFRSNDPTNLSDDPKRIWARTDTGELKYTVDGVVINKAISNADLPYIDIRWFGAKGDGITNNSSAIQSAFAYMLSTGRRCLVIPDGYFRISQTVTFDFNGLAGFTILSIGRIKADAGIKEAFRFQNGRNIKANFIAEGGGQFNSSNSNNYSTFAKDTTGVDVLVHIRGISGFELSLSTYNFAGRGFEIETAASGEPKTELMNFGKMILTNIGQSFCVNVGQGSGVGNLGHFFAIERNGFYAKGNDITLPYYENYMYADIAGCRFESCTSVHCGKILLGDKGTNMLFIVGCGRLSIDEAFFRGRDLKDIPSQRGLTILNSYQIKANVQSMSLTGSPVFVSNTKNSEFDIMDDGTSDVGFQVDTQNGNNEDIYIKSVAHAALGYVSINSGTPTANNINIHVSGVINRFLIQGKRNEVIMHSIKTIADTNMTSASDSLNDVTAIACKTTYSDGLPTKII